MIGKRFDPAPMFGLVAELQPAEGLMGLPSKCLKRRCSAAKALSSFVGPGLSLPFHQLGS